MIIQIISEIYDLESMRRDIFDYNFVYTMKKLKILDLRSQKLKNYAMR